MKSLKLLSLKLLSLNIRGLGSSKKFELLVRELLFLKYDLSMNLRPTARTVLFFQRFL